MKINTRKLKQDIRQIEAEIAEGKGPLRSAWTRPMGETQWALIRLRRRATDLYTLRAWNRGKLHRQNPPEAIRAVSASWDAKEHAPRCLWGTRYGKSPDSTGQFAWKCVMGAIHPRSQGHRTKFGRPRASRLAF